MHIRLTVRSPGAGPGGGAQGAGRRPGGRRRAVRAGEPAPAARRRRTGCVAHLSVRQFERRFVDATGLPPGRWITHQRIRAGAALLESADHPIEVVASRVGPTVAGFRRHFREATGVSPSTYRRQFRPAG
ncbi:helix-turn-helix domain-containing protein [Kitasatospora sp. NPDC001547]|uniref:helix-turn-helix domain-containing protein n=1 Tax=Kitasatospora sp. NPDC001547 TaxID=3364015 RepID=UPI0036A7FBCD